MKYLAILFLSLFFNVCNSQIETFKAFKATYEGANALTDSNIEFVFDYKSNEITMIQENSRSYKILEKTENATLIPLPKEVKKDIYYANSEDEFYAKIFNCENDVIFFLLQKKDDFDENIYRYTIIISTLTNKVPSIYFFCYKK